MTASEPCKSTAVRPAPVALPYRRDLDGMRAIAVIAVILYHTWPRIVTGGFAGVDVFFVISGFLITGIILTGLKRGSFSFTEFYSRRIRRIFPSLIVVLLFCLAFGWFTLVTTEWKSLVKSTLAGAVFTANLLRPEKAGYFDSTTHSQPLRHLWSLGVEEQFYIIWPLLMVGAWKLSKRWKWPSTLLIVFLAIAGVSFLFNLAMWPSHPNVAFFSPMTRMWELLAGAALTQLSGLSTHRIRREFMSVAGMALICWAMIRLKGTTPTPGPWTLLPVLGTALVIAAGSEAWLNRRVLSFRPLVGVGLISYPLYLWHWVLLVFFQLIMGTNRPLTSSTSVFANVALLTLVLTASWATYRFVELPMRFSATLSSKLRVRVLAANMALVAILAAISLRYISPRLGSPALTACLKVKTEYRYLGGWKDTPLKTYEVASGSGHSALLIGDSHMEHYYARAEFAIRRDPRLLHAVFSTFGACPPLPEINQREPGYRCPEFYRYWQALARESRFSTIALSADWLHYTPEATIWEFSVHGRAASPTDLDEAWGRLGSDLRALVRSGRRVVIISSSPSSHSFDPALGIPRIPAQGFEDQFHGIARRIMEERLEPAVRRLTQAASYSGAEIISPLDYLCDRKECPALDTDATPIYMDWSHIRPSKVIKFATFIDDVLTPPMATANR